MPPPDPCCRESRETCDGLGILIIQDSRENRAKCSLTPIEGLPGIEFVRLPKAPRPGDRVEVGSGILLHLDGPPLSKEDLDLLRGGGKLVLVDGSWARLRKALLRLTVRDGARLEKRSLPPGLQTAYPRVSKVHADPAAGLASIEALYAATVVLGRPRAELLRGYRWSAEFIERNRALFLDLEGREGV